MGDLWNILLLDARMKEGWITGKALRDYLEPELELVFSADPWKLSGGWGVRASGMSFRFDALAETSIGDCDDGRLRAHNAPDHRERQAQRLHTLDGCSPPRLDTGQTESGGGLTRCQHVLLLAAASTRS